MSINLFDAAHTALALQHAMTPNEVITFLPNFHFFSTNDATAFELIGFISACTSSSLQS